MLSFGSSLNITTNSTATYPLYINEDLTARRASLDAFETRQLKQLKNISDCWTANGEVFVKDYTNKIMQMSTADELKLF